MTAPVARTRTQIARALGRGPSELFRMLTCLENRGYLYRDPASGGYSLSLRLFELSRTHSSYESILRVARPAMYQLTLEIGESCHLSVLHKKKLMVLAQEESPQPFRYSVEVGALHPLHRMPSGRIILANMSPEERGEILDHDPDFQAFSPKQKDQFARRLDLIRRRGYEMSAGEVIVGLINIGVPIGRPVRDEGGPDGRDPSAPRADAVGEHPAGGDAVRGTRLAALWVSRQHSERSAFTAASAFSAVRQDFKFSAALPDEKLGLL